MTTQNAVPFSRADRSLLAQWWWTVDKAMLGAIFVLSIVGVILVSTASPSVAIRIGASPAHFLMKHVVFLAPALGGMLVLSFMSGRMIRAVSLAVFGVSILGMILTMTNGFEVKGAQRWINVFGFTIQPSEILKPSFLILSAWLLSRIKQSDNIKVRRSGLAAVGGLLVLCLALLLSQPDLGMSVLLCAAFGVQLFLFGIPLRYFVLLIGGGVVGLVLCYFALDHVQSRIDRFLDPSSGDSYQIDRSLESFANGGLMGTGPGQGTVKTQLPDAHADFIFSVAGEEFGFMFTLLIMAIYGYIIWRGYKILINVPSLFAMICGWSLLGLIALQSMIHMGSAMQLLPAKGMTLPMVSYGGSSLLATGYAFGVILALMRGSKKKLY